MNIQLIMAVLNEEAPAELLSDEDVLFLEEAVMDLIAEKVSSSGRSFLVQTIASQELQ
jgi:hypothetical protein